MMDLIDRLGAERWVCQRCRKQFAGFNPKQSALESIQKSFPGCDSGPVDMTCSACFKAIMKQLSERFGIVEGEPYQQMLEKIGVNG